MSSKIHFIAIGGSAMHNLAIALHKKGYTVSGSDDEIFNPARQNLEKYGILPKVTGWFPEKITDDLEAVILGMHAKSDNPELLKAQEKGLKIFSYPEYLYEQSKNKKRIVIGGSHGKTTITAMILHVLKKLNVDVDYMVGAKLEGYEIMVKITDTAEYMIFEGDEYLTSPIDLRPKFHLYKPDIALISGIAWDHANVFKTYEDYKKQFRIFAEMVPEDGRIIYCSKDSEVFDVIETSNIVAKTIPYSLPKNEITEGKTYITTDKGKVFIEVFGEHNLMNMEGAKLVCESIGISEEDFYENISDFKGAANRLEKIYEKGETLVFKDFAHAPSKVKATIHAMKNQFGNKKLIACFELHTFSSMSKDFLPQYKNSMNDADVAVVYFSKHALQLKRLPMLDSEYVVEMFGRKDLKVFNDIEQLKEFLQNQDFSNANLLMMSSGNWDGMDLRSII